MRRVFRLVASNNVARAGLVTTGLVVASSSLYAASNNPVPVPPVVSAPPVDLAVTKEPYTGCAFRNEIDGLQLLGVGLRSKYSYFSVYAYAIYAQRALFEGQAASDVFPRLINGDERKLLRLVFQRDITGQDLKDALKVSLEPRVDAANRAQLEEFFSQFPTLKLSTGTTLQFYISGDKIITFFEDQRLQTVSSKVVAAALLDVYLGSTPISSDFAPSIKKTLKLK
jgi:hypothetical protein